MTAELRSRGDLAMLGIVQEQHPDRARLFMQWKQMDWPVLADVFNELQVRVVPITLLIDEFGVVRAINPRGMKPVEDFLAAEYERPAELAPDPLASDPAPEDVADVFARLETADGQAEAGRALVAMSAGYADHFDVALEHFRRAAALEPEAGLHRFQLGVALRARFDSRHREPGDFQAAADAWRTALDLDPNQYIWRRRIQQYGPRLDKPYPFYDWVPAAREAIEARGDVPVTLLAEPSGAEYARPARSFEAEASAAPAPDPDGRITRDERGFVDVETVTVVHTTPKRVAARVHVIARPNRAIKAHWNNESTPMTLWIDAPEGWTVDRSRIEVPNPTSGPTSDEVRRLEFEVQAPADAPPGEATIRGYLLYNVCEGADGVCLYRRQDVEITITVPAAG